MYLLARWLINAIALLAVAYLVPGIAVSGFLTALLVALVLGLVNALLRPLLVILTLPITIMTLGLFMVVINGFLFWLVSTFVSGFTVSSFWIAIVGSLVFSILSWLGSEVLLHGGRTSLSNAS